MARKPVRRVRQHGKITTFLSKLARRVFQPKTKQRGTTKDLDAEAKLHARAAKAAYDDLPSDKLPSGYQHERISPEMAVLKNPESKKAVIGIRGTKNIGDALTDVAVGLGDIRTTERYKRTRAEVERVKKELGPEYEVSLAGHSLGGALAHHIADEFGMKGHVFNPASSLGNVPQTEKVTAHMTVDDPVSMFYRTKGATNTYTNPDKGVLAAHTIDAYAYGRRYGMMAAFAGGSSPGVPF